MLYGFLIIAMNLHNQTHFLILLTFLCSHINTTLSDKDKNEHETWVKKKTNNNNNNTAIQGTSAELVKKTAPILLNNSVQAGMSEVLCKAN